MLLVLKQESGTHFIYLLNGKEYVVGRKNADIIISNDQSISRKHAIIKVENNSVKLIDCESKYGTCHKGDKIEANIEVALEDQDLIKFGVFQSTYKFEKITIVATCSGLNNIQKNELKKNIELLGGTFLKNWESPCTHLTLQEIMLSVKVLHALLDDKPFVKLEYWKIFAQNMKESQPPPKVEDFKPTSAEKFLHDSLLVSKPERKVLFKDKIFVFPTQKIKSKMEDLILKTGGKCISWDKEPVSVSNVINSKHNYIFITSEEVQEIPRSLEAVYQRLREDGQRTIPIQEIAMAILLCSCKQDCNPRFNKVEKVFLKTEVDSNSENIPLAFETQSQTQEPTTQPKEELVVPESLDGWNYVKSADNKKDTFLPVNYGASTSKDVYTSSSTPHKRSVAEPEGNPPKKVKLNEKPIMEKTENNSKKRKADEILEMPTKKASLHDNLFDISRSKSNKKSLLHNPFASLRVKQEKDLDNPFLRILEQRSNNSVEEIVPESNSVQLHSDSSYIYEKSKNLKLSEIKWLSKPSEEIKVEDLNIECDLKEFYDKFKNCVKIEVLPPFVKRANTSNECIDGSIRSGSVKNFKKFKKVQPVKPQVSIVSTTVVHTLNASNREVIVLSGDEEVEKAPVFKGNKVKRTTRFEF